MPLRCLEPESKTSILAFDLSPDAWRALEVENRRRRHLRLPCCSAEVVLRRSRLGTRFFAHKAIGACTTAPETEEHLRLKRMAVEAARAAGWAAETEVAGRTPEGELWRADVLASKGEARIAIEVQWSPQTDEETLRRQERYRASGVLGLWLFRQPAFPVVEDLPAACIRGTPEEGFTAVLPSGPGWECHSLGKAHPPALPVPEFLAAAFDGRLHFGLPPEAGTHVAIRAALMGCWKCPEVTVIVTGVDIEAGPRSASLTVPQLGEHPAFWNQVLDWLPDDFPAHAIQRRFSRTQEREYLSNGCIHCGAMIGEFFEHEAWDEEVVHEATVPLEGPWCEVLERRGWHAGYWRVF